MSTLGQERNFQNEPGNRGAREIICFDAVHTYEKWLLPRSAEIAQMLEGGAEQLLSVPDPDEIAPVGQPQP